MVDWAAAATVQQAYSTFSELNHIFCGFYIWDYIKDIRYEWSYIRRRRDKRSWMALCNIVCRLATLTSVILLLALMNLPRPSYCQAVWITLGLLSSLATLCALLIIAHRITLVWPSNRPVQVVVSIAWLAAVGSLLYGLLKARSAWDLRLGTCTVQDTACLRAPALILLVIDTLFVSLLLWGCYMLPSIAVMSFWTKLYRLGALPLAAAAMIQLAFTVCVFVDINDAMNLMFHAPALVMLSAASTRIYRVLEPYHNGLTHLSRVFVGTSFMTDPEMLFATNPAINRTIRSPRTSNTLEVDERDPSHARGAGSSSISLQPLKETTSLTQVRLCQSEADLSKPHPRTKSRML